MPLSPWVKPTDKCCAKCTKKPTLSGCHLDFGCPCHLGFRPKPAIEINRDIHKCVREFCPECL